MTSFLDLECNDRCWLFGPPAMIAT